MVQDDQFASSYRFVRWLHERRVCVFGLPILAACCSYGVCISPTIVPGSSLQGIYANFNCLYYAPMVQEKQFASSYRFVRWLHKRRVWIFGLHIPAASCSYVVCISATIVPGSGLQGIYPNFHCRYYAAMLQDDQFASSYRFVRRLHKRRVCVFGLPIPATPCSYVVCISATIVPSSGLQGIYANFHCLYYAATVQEEQFASSYRFVRWLHERRVCDFGLPIPATPWSYVVCISATIVPSSGLQGIYANFHCLYCAATVQEEQFASSYRFVRWLHKRRVCVFGLPIPAAPCSYVVCISATIVPSSGLQGIYANFHCRYYAAMVQDDQFASSYRFVRWLHKRRVCVFGLPIPAAPCSYVVCISATIVQARVCREYTRISIAYTKRRWCRMINLQARTALCVDCTNGGFEFLASTFPQLLAHM